MLVRILKSLPCSLILVLTFSNLSLAQKKYIVNGYVGGRGLISAEKLTHIHESIC